MHAFHSIAALARATAFTALAGLCASAAAQEVGTLQNVTGEVTVINSNNESRRAAANERIRPGDRISTAGRSEAVIKMADDSVVALRPTTTFQVNGFRFEKKPTDSSFLSVVKGTVRFITGQIARANPGSTRILAATATMGVRGTDFEVSVQPEDSGDVRAGVYNYVRDGRTNIQLASGPSADVNRGITAFAPENLRPGEDPIQLFAQPPLFLQQGGGLDAVMQSIITNTINTLPQLPRF